MATTPRRGIAVGILLFAGFMDLLDATIVQVVLDPIRRDTGAGEAQLGWVVSGYLLAFAVILVTGGRLGDIAGRRRMFLIGVAGFTLASAACGLAPTAGVLVGARVVQGAFAAIMVPQLLATVQSLYAPKERAPMYGLIGAVSGLAAVVGPLLGGWLADADIWGLGWRAVFWINVPVGLALIVAGARFVPETKASRTLRLDLAGVAVLSAVIVLLMWPLIEGRTLGWPAWLWLPVGAAAILLVVFIRLQRHRAARDGSALLPLSLFGHRGFSAGLVTQASFQGAMNAFTLPFLLYLQGALHFTALGSGLSILAFSVGAMVGTGAVIPLVAKLGRTLVWAGCLVMAAGIVWTTLTAAARGADFTGWDVVAAMAVAGFGLACVVIPLVDVALATIPTDDAGAASGTYSTFQQLGAGVGVAVSTTVFFVVLDGRFELEAMRTALLASTGVAVLGLLIAAGAALMLPGREAVRAHLEQQAALVDA